MCADNVSRSTLTVVPRRHRCLALYSDLDLFIVNCQVPNYQPSNPLWGEKQGDGTGFNFVTYFAIPPAVRKMLDSAEPPPLQAVRVSTGACCILEFVCWFACNSLIVRACSLPTATEGLHGGSWWHGTSMQEGTSSRPTSIRLFH